MLGFLLVLLTDRKGRWNLGEIINASATYRTGHYSSPAGGVGEGGEGDLGEEHLIWLERSVVTENPKAIAENFGRIQREDH